MSFSASSFVEGEYAVEKCCGSEAQAADCFYNYSESPYLELYDLCGGDPGLVDKIRGSTERPSQGLPGFPGLPVLPVRPVLPGPSMPATTLGTQTPTQMRDDETSGYVPSTSDVVSTPSHVLDPPLTRVLAVYLPRVVRQ